MASIIKPKHQPKHCWIQFVDEAGKRQTIRLGVCNKDTAKDHKELVEALLASKLSGFSLPPRIAERVSDLQGLIRTRYIKTGLLPSDGVTTKTQKQLLLGEYLDNYFKSRSTDLKESSQIAMGHTRKRLVEYFGPNKQVVSITANDARLFRTWLASVNKRDKDEDGKAKPLSANTLRRRTGFCKQIFSQAVMDGIIQRNPFAGMAASVRSNKERTHYVSLPTLNKVLKFTPNAKWRAMLVLARVAALRVPSELTGLKWDHIRFEEKRILIVDSSKNERHANRHLRKIPMLPILEKYLLEWQLECEPGEMVFPGVTGQTNLRTTLEKILVKAGVEQWPKLWQNLRASGCTDFARKLPAHIAAAICGHTEQIAKEHYWQVGDVDLDGFLEQSTQELSMESTNQPEAFSEAEGGGNEAKAPAIGNEEVEESLENEGNATLSDTSSGRYWTRNPLNSQGICVKNRPEAFSEAVRTKTQICSITGESLHCTADANNELVLRTSDPELTRIVKRLAKRWPRYTDTQRAMIAQIVDVGTGSKRRSSKKRSRSDATSRPPRKPR
jgi:integrase